MRRGRRAPVPGGKHESGVSRPSRPWQRLARPAALLAVLGLTFAAGPAEAAPTRAGAIATGKYHSCVVVAAAVRCWGYGGDGQLGYGSTRDVGDDETPGSVGAVDVGAGRTVQAAAAGGVHTCALLDGGAVRCWGFGGNGRLGYGGTAGVGGSEAPSAAGPVDLGPGRTAAAIAAGAAHTCAVLDDGNVRCWGSGLQGRLGDGGTADVGVAETPGSKPAVKLGTGRTATAVSAGGAHTCALLDDGSVRCWGAGGSGQLGYGNRSDVGDTPSTTPDTVGPVGFGSGRTAKAIAAGRNHTCALLDEGSVRCWGSGVNGQLGYGSAADVLSPATVGPVPLGPGRTATAIAAGADHTCAILDDGTARCWGAGSFGRLGTASANSIGDAQKPDAVPPIDLGAGRTAVAISAGELHTCALLDDGSVRCWGAGAYGRLGSCRVSDIGDDETPGSLPPVDLGASGAGCMPPPAAGDGSAPPAAPASPPAAPHTQSSGPAPLDPRAREAARAQRLRRCLFSSSNAQARRRCLTREGRTPGRITGLAVRRVTRTRLVLAFRAPGSDGRHAPAAREYLIRQSQGRSRDAVRAPALCHGACRVRVTGVGERVTVTITGLRPRTTYAYLVAARDNVSHRVGPRSATLRVRTR